jgi:hypothetical protein
MRLSVDPIEDAARRDARRAMEPALDLSDVPDDVDFERILAEARGQARVTLAALAPPTEIEALLRASILVNKAKELAAAVEDLQPLYLIGASSSGHVGVWREALEKVMRLVKEFAELQR